MHRRRLDINSAITSLWKGWTMSVGSLTAVIACSLVVSKMWLPFVAYVLELAIFFLVRRNREARVPVCYLLPFITTRILFWSASIMVAINLLFTHGIILRIFAPESLNHQIPYITVLIIAPVAFIISLWAWLKRSRFGFCTDCDMRHGTAAERGFLGILFTQEGRYQNKMLMIFSGILTFLAWGYYMLFYVNVNLNKPDHFFFVIIPVIYCALTLVYMAIRYLGIWGYYCHHVERDRAQGGTTTQLRYLIFCDDYILLDKRDGLSPFANNGKLDTPVTIHLSSRENVPLTDADSYFKNYTRIDDAKVRFMYSSLNGNADGNIFHYIVILPSTKTIDGTELKDSKWYTMPEIQRLINTGGISSLMSAEILRLHTVTMTWKTYDRDGRRLYKIKNYRPTFHLRDIGKWDVDYNDREWLQISRNNEDKPFWRLRRFWRRYINS